MAQNDTIARIRANEKRARRMVKMRDNGKTFEFIGWAFGVSKQRAHAIVSKAKGAA